MGTLSSVPSCGEQSPCIPMWGPKAKFLMGAVFSSPSCEEMNNSQVPVWGSKAQFLIGGFSSVPTCGALGDTAHVGTKVWTHDESCLLCTLLWFIENIQPSKGQKSECLMGTASSVPYCGKLRTCIPTWGLKAECLMEAATSAPSCAKTRPCDPMWGLKTEFIMRGDISVPTVEKEVFEPTWVDQWLNSWSNLPLLSRPLMHERTCRPRWIHVCRCLFYTIL